MQKIFDPGEAEDDADRIVKTFFWSMHQARQFLWALELTVLKHGCAIDEEGCTFPDWNDAPELHFNGVMFYTFQEETLISEQKCSEYIDAACAEYVAANPHEAEKVREILRTRLV